MARPRDETIDRAIIRACIDLLGEIGRSRLTRQGVARRAGVSLPAVTRRYATIDDLILAVVSTPSTPPPALPLLSVESYLVELLCRSVRVGRQPGQRRAAVELLAAAAGDARTARAFSSTVEALRSEALRVLDQARLVGDLPSAVEPELLLDQLYGSIWYRQLWRHQQLTDDDLRALVQATLAPHRRRAQNQEEQMEDLNSPGLRRRLSPVGGVPPAENGATLIVMVGLPAAVKTTRARELATAHAALRLTPDHWMIPLYDDSMADGKRFVVEGRLISVALQALRLGTSVVLDYGLWGRDERSALHWLARASGVDYRMVYLPVDEDTQLARIARRQEEEPHQTFPMSRSDVDQWRRQFQVPDAEELEGGNIPDPPTGWVGWAEWAADHWPSCTDG